MIIEPELFIVESGPVTLGLPACAESAKIQHRWSTGITAQVPRFSIARYAVTMREFTEFISATGYSGPPELEEERFKAPDQPAVGLSWNDADAYARWLAGATGKPYRLPSDAEWEKAARGGLNGRLYPWGDDPPTGRACYGLNKEKGHPRPVGSFAPNGYGLYDMVGNIWQWCSDLYTETSAIDKPVNTPTNRPASENRVLRGGSFMTEDPAYLWCAYRHEDPPDLRHACLGMRLVMSL